MKKKSIIGLLLIFQLNVFCQISFIDLFDDMYSEKHIGKELYFRGDPENFQDTSYQSIEINLKDLENLDKKSFESLCENKSLIYLKIYNSESFSDTTERKCIEFEQLKYIKILVFGGNFPNFDNTFFSKLNKMPNLEYLVFTYLPNDMNKYADHEAVMQKLKGLKIDFGNYVVPDKNKLVSFISDQNDKTLKANLKKIKVENILNLNISADTLDESYCKIIGRFKNLKFLSINYSIVKPGINLSFILKKLKKLEILKHKRCRSEDLVYLPTLKKLKTIKLVFRKDKVEDITPVFNCPYLEDLDIASDSNMILKISKINSPCLKKLKIYGHLKEIPLKIFEIISLNELNLIFNDIEYLPKEIEKLEKLEVLNMDHNKLDYLPNEFCNLHNLKNFFLSENYLTELPENFGKLSNLITLDLSGNDIVKIPPSIGNCNNLESLNLDANFIQKLPNEITKLINLKNLSLNKNNLIEIPFDIDNINTLENIELSNDRNYQFLDKKSVRVERKKNDLKELPESLAKLKYLKNIDIGENPKISDKSLEIFLNSESREFRLNLSGCGIITLPDSGWQKINFKRLNLYDNKIKKLPKSFFESNIQEVDLRKNDLGKLNTYIENPTNLKIIGYLAGYISKDELMKQDKLIETIIEISNRYYYNEGDNPVLEIYSIANEIDSIKAFNLIDHEKYANALFNSGRYTECIPHYKLAIDDNLQGCVTILNDLLECLQKMSKAYLYTSDTLNCIKGLELLQNTYKLNFNSEIGMLYKLMKNIDKSEVYFKKEQKRLNAVKTNNDYEMIGNQLNLLELFLISEDYETFDSLSQLIKIENEKEYLLRYFYIFEYLKILRQSTMLNFENLVNEFTNELKNSKYSNYEWSCRLVEYWSKLQPEKIKPIIFKLNNAICPEGY